MTHDASVLLAGVGLGVIITLSIIAFITLIKENLKN